VLCVHFSAVSHFSLHPHNVNCCEISIEVSLRTAVSAFAEILPFSENLEMQLGIPSLCGRFQASP
jgi:hypothetical protein